MRILARYISGIYVRNFVMAAFGLTLLFLFQSLLSELLDRGYPPNQVLVHELLRVPEIFVQMCPPAVMIATVLTLSGLNRSAELTACYSIGIGLSQITMVLFAIVFMISCFNLVLQDRIIPPVYRKRTTYYYRVMQNRPDFFFDVKRNKIWYRSENLIYNLRSFDVESKTIFGMSVYRFNDAFQLLQMVEAKRAMFTPRGWKMLEGTETDVNARDEFPVTKRFDEKDLAINETPNDFREIGKRINGLRLKELSRYVATLKKTGIDAKKPEVHFHSRISLSFIPLVMAFLAVPFSVRRTREGGIGKDLGICLGVTFFYWIFYSIGLSMGTKGALPPWLAAWLPSFVFAAVAMVLISRRR